MADTSGIFVEIVSREFENLKMRIAGNIKSAGKWASGKTADSLHTEVERIEDTTRVSFVGASNFWTLETGNPPGRRGVNFASSIYQWSKDKGIAFDGKSDKQRRNFSDRTAAKIEGKGDTLYRAGGRRDVYTEPIEVSVCKIDEELSGIVNGITNQVVRQIMSKL